MTKLQTVTTTQWVVVLYDADTIVGIWQDEEHDTQAAALLARDAANKTTEGWTVPYSFAVETSAGFNRKMARLAADILTAFNSMQDAELMANRRAARACAAGDFEEAQAATDEAIDFENKAAELHDYYLEISKKQDDERQS